MIDNFKVIDNFLQFEEGTFYKFELLVRNTDGENILFPERVSNTNRNILIKSWYVDTKDYYEKIKHEMVTLANMTGARLYVTLDRKDNVKLCQSLIKAYTDDLVAIVNSQKPSIKSISKTFASETSKVENSSKSTKTIMFDVDTKDKEIKQAIIDYIEMKRQNNKGESLPKVKAYVLETKKGYHIFCYRKFNIQDWLDYSYFRYKKLMSGQFTESFKNIDEFKEVVSVKENELGLVYHPMKMEETFYDKLYNLVEPYLDGDFVGYNEEKQAFDIVQAIQELLEENKFDINNLKDTYTYMVDYQLYSDGKDAMYRLNGLTDFKEAKSFYE